ncbi:lysoplasmalogenase [Actinacidiphila glaucinigra]|uniref:lysoplasmalogenase n=1 Tax=Actinacidiphila glaucinigra TaxID=235986 RepID=UPI002E2F0755|nr:lysoplasmalogenase [Actinacidiphila glaucinigra]
MTRERAARAATAAFAVVAAAHLAAQLAGSATAGHLTKPVLVPLLAACAVLRGGPRLLVAALLCGWAGDVLLQFDGDASFLLGMGAFAAGHVCYLTLFTAGGAFADRRRAARTAAGYAVVWLAALVVVWPGLPSGLRVPVAAYSLLLTAMAAGAAALGPRATAVGGALFLLSDTLLATRLADLPQLPAADFWIMLGYLAAQFLLSTGRYGGTTPFEQPPRTTSYARHRDPRPPRHPGGGGAGPGGAAAHRRGGARGAGLYLRQRPVGVPRRVGP